MQLTFTGSANHAGTTPMSMRRDALAAASEWILAVEREALAHPGAVATVGQLQVEPGAGNVVPGCCRASLDLRHEFDRERTAARDRVVAMARSIAAQRRLDLDMRTLLEQPAVPLDPAVTERLAGAVSKVGLPVHRLTSGAGHDAMVLAPRIPAAMLFVRSPGGVSHHPDETVIESDVAAALTVLRELVLDLGLHPSGTHSRA
jgi:allantoate deiminase